MIYAYVKHSGKTQKDLCRFREQVRNIEHYTVPKSIRIDKWFDRQKIGYVLSQMSSGDTLLASRISNLGSSLSSIEKIIDSCLAKNIKVIVIEGNYVFENNPAMQLLLSALKLAMKMQSELKSQIASDALSKLQSDGKKLGRPQGSRNKELKLMQHKDKICGLLSENVSKSEIARRLKVNRMTLYAFLRRLSDKPM